MRRFLQGLVVGIVAAFAVGVAAAPITGPQDVSQLYATLNQQLLAWMTVNANNGELQLLGSSAFVDNGTTATSVTSVGPLNAHTTVQRWMVVMTPGGTQGFVPVF